MITSYCLSECSFVSPAGEETAEASAGSPVWIDVQEPTPDEIADLQQRYGVPIEFLQAVLDKNERPRLEQEGDVTLVLTRASQGEEPRRHLPFATCPLAMIITPTVLITLCNRPNLVQCLLLRKLRAGVQYRPARIALNVLMRMSTTYIEHLRQMDERTEKIEQALQESMQNSELVRMLHIEKSLIYVLTSIKGNHAVLERLHHTDMLVLSSNEKNVLSNVIIENRQAMEMAEVFSQILGSVSDAFGAMISNNLNKAMKFLTGMTIVLLIPSIVAALYGMNVPLPLQENPHAFALICALCFATCAVVWMYFKKKNWM